jgi:hypothetical protein
MKDFILRHSTLLLLIAATWLLVGASKEVTLQTALTVATFEGIALLLIYLVLYVFSPVNWLKELSDEMAKRSFRNKTTFTASLVMVAVVVASVHILCGFVVWGVYFTRYSPIP